MRRSFNWLLVALILGALLLSLPYQIMPARRVEVGAEAASSALAGFSFPEVAANGQAFRWSEAGAAAKSLAEGMVDFPGVAPAASDSPPARVPRPAGKPVVKVTVDEREIGSFPAGGGFTEQVFVPAVRPSVRMAM